MRQIKGGNKMEMNKDQKQVMAAFGDSLKVERPGFTTEGTRQLEDLISHTVTQAFDSVNHLEGEEGDQLKAYIIEQMKEYTRRGLQRAVKGMVKEAESAE
jgi:hypothetical protein